MMSVASSSAQHASSSSSPGNSLHVTIRFSNSHPDLDLDIPEPETTTVLCLKSLLRSSIASHSRLRLIYRGRLLPDTAAISSALPQPQQQPPPPPHPLPPAEHVDPSGKGKARLDPPPRIEVPIQRVYVNCSIGDELTAEELAQEREAALLPPDTSASASGAAPPTSTRPRPRGFDRLLQSGFTASEIATLRTQFASIHNERFAPDSLPSPDTMRGLEDAWIDNNAGDAPNTAAARAFQDEGSSMATVLDVLIRGMMIGFFFPLGAMTWLLRQDGIWSEKWQVFVGSGVVLSLTVGVVMSLSGTP